MDYTITARDKRRMKSIFFQLYRFGALSLRFMKLTRLGCALPSEGDVSASKKQEVPRVMKTT